MTAVEHSVRSVSRPSLDDFLGFYRAEGADDLVARVCEAYERVHPLEVNDVDLVTFLNVLYLTVRYWRPKAVVQTGTFVGTSSVAIALGLADNGHGTLFTIDPEPRSYFDVREPVAIARAVIGVAGLGPYVHFIRGYSTMALDGERMALPVAPTWCLPALSCSGRYDMLVVDGDHTFRGCYLDLVHGAAGLASTGSRLVIVHDYLGIPEVRAAVCAWTGEALPAEQRVVPSPCGIALMRLAEHALRPMESTDRRS